MMQEFFITLKIEVQAYASKYHPICFVYWTMLHYALVFRKNIFFYFCDSQFTYMGMLIYLAYLKEFMSREFVNSQKPAPRWKS